MGEQLYVDLWNQHKPKILSALANASTKQTIELKEEDFQNVGNRKKYSFNLEFKDGFVSNNIGGSAVARDLARVLENTSILSTGHYKLNMGIHFILSIQKL